VSRRWFAVIAVPALLFAACGGGGSTTAVPSAPSTTEAAPAATVASRPPIAGVQTYTVEASHAEGPLTYPQTPPVGGAHNQVWQACTYYDMPVPNEKAVHSLEHGAVWVTYQPDLAATDVAALATLARSRDHILVSPYAVGLPSPVVVTAWGRQLRLETVGDPRLAEFVRLYINKGPEAATC